MVDPSYLTLQLADGRVLEVGPRVEVLATHPDGHQERFNAYRLACFVEAYPGDVSGPATVHRADGSAMGHLLTVQQAIDLAPDVTEKILAAAVALYQDSLEQRLAPTCSDAFAQFFDNDLRNFGDQVRAAQQRLRPGMYGGDVDAEPDAAAPSPIAAFTLPDGRTLLVGPQVAQSVLFDDGSYVTVPLHLLGCAVGADLDETTTDLTLTDEMGVPIAQPITVSDAVAAAPDLAMEILAAAGTLIQATQEIIEATNGSVEPADAAFRHYVVHNLPGFAQEVAQARKNYQLAQRAALERDLGGFGL